MRRPAGSNWLEHLAGGLIGRHQGLSTASRAGLPRESSPQDMAIRAMATMDSRR